MLELKQKLEVDLQKMLIEKRSKLFDLRINLNEGQIKSTSDIKKSRKDIARILTILKSKYGKK